MNILFRADSSSSIGTGHIMRDLVLAKQYQKSNIIFATQSLDGNINDKITQSGYRIVNILSNEISELIEVINFFQIDMIIIDHYGINFKFEKELKEKTGINIMVLDDTYEKHYCDILLNHNIYAKEKKYKKLVPNKCELHCGSRYTLLRDEFIKVKAQKTIFLAMGGADHSNINLKILKVLNLFDNTIVNVVTTRANKNIKELKAYVKDKKWIKLHINSDKIAKLMKKADLAIVTPSVILNEIFFMQVPFIAIKVIDNQRYMYQFLKREKFLAMKNFNEKKLIKNLNTILEII